MPFRPLSAALKGTLCKICWHSCPAWETMEVPPGFQLAEDARTAAARAALADRVEKLKSARQIINELAGVPATGSCASVVTVSSKLDGTTQEEGGDEHSGMDHAYRFACPSDVKESSALVDSPLAWQPNPLPIKSAASQAHTVEDAAFPSWAAANSSEKGKGKRQLRRDNLAHAQKLLESCVSTLRALGQELELSVLHWLMQKFWGNTGLQHGSSSTFCMVP